MEYNFNLIEKKWQQQWQQDGAYTVYNNTDKPKCYVLDMFPYPSGAGLHVGHPLGYIASDIYARYKRLKGYNVLHPMGYDAFGLPAEQYAIEHGIHPAVSTANNMVNFKEQLNNIGFSYDWDRCVNTSDPAYYKWTQWMFLTLFNAYYNIVTDHAQPIENLVQAFASEGSVTNIVNAVHTFTAAQWNAYTPAQQRTILMEYRLAYCGYGIVNWCAALGTVLANDEVVNGVSERGGHPVEKKRLRQWYLRITAYANRLLQGLDTVQYSDAMKDMQRNWIGKSEGAEIVFDIANSHETITVYTTRPDTIYGVDFIVLAPELTIIPSITTTEQANAVAAYITYVKSRSDIERMAEKKITGCFTGAYAINPISNHSIPIYISEYVLAGYGTGAIMAVPCGDERDYKFAKQYNIPITNIIGNAYDGTQANPTKIATYTNSDLINGMAYNEATGIIINALQSTGKGKLKTNYKMRDAAFSRQRYWGEPFPIIWVGDVAYDMSKEILPLVLPHLDVIKPGDNGAGPLANLTNWVSDYKQYKLHNPISIPDLDNTAVLETSTMPGYAGSSWYFLRYMDPHNQATFCDKKISDYWNQVDVYVGGTEHAVGHLLYSRMFTKALYDLGYISFDEPFKKLLNQGMITGSSRFVYRVNGTHAFVSKHMLTSEAEYNGTKVDKLHVDVNIVDGLELNMQAFIQWRNGEYAQATFITEADGTYICGSEVEKMSKSKFNTVNPNDLVAKYGADTFRMYEMFLGPVEMSKPWDTKGIEGVHRFLKKLWRLFYTEDANTQHNNTASTILWNNDEPTPAELKVLHRTIKKIEEDTEKFSYNTAVSAFMICVNELSELKCHKQAILAPLLVLLHPYAPHITAELYNVMYPGSKVLPYGISNNHENAYPTYQAKYVAEDSKNYPVSINGKMRTTIAFNTAVTQEEVERTALANEVVLKWLNGATPTKIIFVKNKMVNIVIPQ